jgi:thiamine biosynthesis lipoprotein
VIARARPLLGTYVEIRAPAGCQPAIRAAFDAVARVQALMSFHDAGSELSRLNLRAHVSPQSVHRWTWRVLCACRRLHAASGGAFDPAVAARLVAAGQLPQPAGPRPAFDASFADVLLFPRRQVAFRRPLWLDLGGIAKGFAVDVAVAVLRARGVGSAVVNAGGDLRCIGQHPQTVALRDHEAREPPRTLGWLLHGACATSAAIDTLAPQSGIRAAHGYVTVAARTCMMADALTKIVALDAGRAAPLLAHYHAIATTHA